MFQRLRGPVKFCLEVVFAAREIGLDFDIIRMVGLPKKWNADENVSDVFG